MTRNFDLLRLFRHFLVVTLRFAFHVSTTVCFHMYNYSPITCMRLFCSNLKEVPALLDQPGTLPTCEVIQCFTVLPLPVGWLRWSVPPCDSVRPYRTAAGICRSMVA